jgi:preprotein translocase subunit SecE
MAKKQNAALGNFVENSENAKQQNNVKKEKKKSNKPGFFKRLGTKIKDVFSELKKVSWPTFSKVVKQTCVVLLVVLIFLIVITAFDTGLTELVRLFNSSFGR